MESTVSNIKNMLKPSRTLIDVQQAIDNLTRLNTDGRYTERLLELSIEKLQIQIWIKHNANTVRLTYKASPNEEKAITAFYADKRFKITE